MKSTGIELSPQVVGFIKQLAPEPRKKLRTALRELAEGKGDIIELESPLEGFHRLRAGRYRIVYEYASKGKSQSIRCVYVERRELVYELFADLIKGE